MHRSVHGFVLTSLVLALSLVGCALVGCAGTGSQTEATAAEESPPAASEARRVDWALAIHGGAGVISKDMEEDTKQEYFAALEQALTVGRRHLEQGGSSLDAVEMVVRTLEDDPKFNAGKGAVYTHEGTHELDAAIMDGRQLEAGAVAAVKTIKNPILLARRVMEVSPHVFLIGEGAEAFAAEQGLERVEQDYFHTERRREQLDRILERERSAAAAPSVDQVYSTVGAVALDRDGNLAAATSTGGMTNKRFGRVGDVPVIGAGTYADNRACAVSGTGHGEKFIRHTVARSIAARMQFDGASLAEAAEAVIHGELDPGDGGVIAVSHTGEIALVFNSEGMFRGAADSSGRFEVAIWE